MSLLDRIKGLFGGDDGEPPKEEDAGKTELHTHRATGGDVAIIFIHGFGGDAVKTWGAFPELLAADSRLDGWDIYFLGYHTSLAPDILRGIWSSDPDLDELAGFLSTQAAHGTLGKYKQLALVAHSMGGLVTQRALANDTDLRNRTRHVFLFGTPSGGLVKASLGSILKDQLKNMGADSAFITKLRSDWDADFDHWNFCFWVTAGDQDEFVPDTSSLGPFPDTTEGNECTPDNRVQKRIVAGNHVQIVKPAESGTGHRPVDIVIEGIDGGTAGGGASNSARVAVAQGEFQSVIDRWGDHPDELDQEALVDLALAYDATGRPDEAMQLLDGLAKSNDAKGTLAGRYKRRWLFDRREADAERALALYTEAHESAAAEDDHEGAYYLGINVAFMHFAYTKEDAAKTDMAKKALDHASKTPQSMWRHATEGEAQLYLGDHPAALASYEKALAAGPDPRQVDSMYGQAATIADRLDNEELTSNIQKVFTRT